MEEKLRSLHLRFLIRKTGGLDSCLTEPASFLTCWCRTGFRRPGDREKQIVRFIALMKISKAQPIVSLWRFQLVLGSAMVISASYSLPARPPTRTENWLTLRSALNQPWMN